MQTVLQLNHARICRRALNVGLGFSNLREFVLAESIAGRYCAFGSGCSQKIWLAHQPSE
jgi:hypothetical protein